MEFAPGVTVFPGGGQDPQDADLRATAVREVLEETGVSLDPAALLPWARWVTPEGETRRYDTLFFVAVLPHGAEPEATGTEMDAVQWMQPGDALAARDARELKLMPPTLITLRQLAECVDIADVLVQAVRRKVEPVNPKFVRDGAANFVELPDGERFSL
jgi:8-oxo-dGTP pyrophosphatase MutT (NUDIX family)